MSLLNAFDKQTGNFEHLLSLQERLQAEFKAKKAKIAAQDAKIAAQDSKIAARDAKIAAQDAEIAALRKDVADLGDLFKASRRVGVQEGQQE